MKKKLQLGGLRQLPRVYPAEEILNRAINSALYVNEDISVRNSRQRGRKWAAEQINELSKGLTKPTGEILDGYNKVLRRLQPFEKVVADLTIKARELSGYGSLAETLAAVKELRKNSLAICKAAAQAGKNADTRKQAEKEVEVCIASVEELWERDGWCLDVLLDMGKELRGVPMLSPDLDTVVLVGSPNVGKSSIVRWISTGEPEVNNYAFTTRGMTLGHMFTDDHEELLCQVMDTPGLLPRRDADRNEMEKLTVASMELLEGVVVFVQDLSEAAGGKSSTLAQAAVRAELRARFPDHLWLDVVSKADLPLHPHPHALVPDAALRVSSRTGEGMEELEAWVRGALLENAKRREARDLQRRMRRVD